MSHHHQTTAYEQTQQWIDADFSQNVLAFSRENKAIHASIEPQNSTMNDLSEEGDRHFLDNNQTNYEEFQSKRSRNSSVPNIHQSFQLRNCRNPSLPNVFQNFPLDTFQNPSLAEMVASNEMFSNENCNASANDLEPQNIAFSQQFNNNQQLDLFMGFDFDLLYK